MTFFFTIKEGFKGFGRARLSTTITIISVAFALLLIGYFIMFSMNINNLIGDVRSKIELDVFLIPAINETDGYKIQQQILRIKGIEGADLISKEEAARKFEKEFGRDIFDVLGSNPLPITCTVKIKEGFQSAVAINGIVREIEKINGVDEVVYQRDLLSIIDRYINLIYIVAGSIGFLLIVIAVVLLYNTIRLTILARSDIIEIMKLVGATSTFIRRPFVVEGFMQGLIGALIACGLLYLSLLIVQQWIYPYAVGRPEVYAFIIVFGMAIGLFSSRLSVSKHLS
jgi:cell division transport system permease protein